VSEALHALEFWTGWHRDTIPLYINGQQGRTASLLGVPQRLFEGELTTSAEGCPRVSFLWAWVHSGDQVKDARKFRPAPSYVLQIGSTLERFLLWPLEEPILDLTVEAANKRISYALRAPYVRSTVEALRIPLPGSMVGKKLVSCTRCDHQTFACPEEIVGRLREPPEPSWSRITS